MSHDIFFQFHEHGGEQMVPTEAILREFAPFLRDRGGDNGIEIEFDEHNSSVLFISASADSVSHFMVNRPCGDPRLDELMFKAGLLGHVVTFEPGIENPIVFRESTVAHLPSELLEGMGTPVCLASLEEYRSRYETCS